MKKKYAIVGVGVRGISMFVRPLVKEYQDVAELVALCDRNPLRAQVANNQLGVNLPIYTDFDEMLAKEEIDIVIVTTRDSYHHEYIVRALEHGKDVITEKPMTIDAEKCQQILDTIKQTGRKLRVTFNYRYSPYNTKIRELIMNDTIGQVTSVHFEWLLNTSHGADYFRRWHRDKRNSGGLLVHKATHHFDLVNFWIGSQPEVVFAMGDLLFYGRENAENRGITKFYYRGTGSDNAKGDPFALDLNRNDSLRKLYLEAEEYDGYLRDQSVFGDGINIEDTMGVPSATRTKPYYIPT